MDFPMTLKNVEAASRYHRAIPQISNGTYMDYETRAGPADIGCIHESEKNKELQTTFGNLDHSYR